MNEFTSEDRERQIEINLNLNNHITNHGHFMDQYKIDQAESKTSRKKMWEKFDSVKDTINDVENRTIVNKMNIKWIWTVVAGVVLSLGWFLKQLLIGDF